jgi:PAS domain S-box-containing protein
MGRERSAGKIRLNDMEQLAHSRMRYADLYDFSLVGYLSLDERKQIEEINLTGGKLLGENPHRLLGRSFLDFIAEEDTQKLLDHLEHCRGSRQKRSLEVRLIPQNSEETYAELYTIATRDVDRRTFQFRVAILNITERKRAEEAVHRSQLDLEKRIEERTSELKASHNLLQSVIDAQVFLNEASAVLSGSLDFETTLNSLVHITVPHLADCCVVDMLQKKHLQRVAVAHVNPEKEKILWDLADHSAEGGASLARAKVIRTGRPELHTEITDKLLHRIARGAERLSLIRTLDFKSYMCVPLIVRGQTIGAISFMLDRPERRYDTVDLALAEDLAYRAAIAVDNATLYSQQQEANRLKDEFLAMVSHELRTPLTPVLGSLFKLRRLRPGDKELHAVLDVIERNARIEARMVEDLLDISRITTGRLELQKRAADLRTLITTAIEKVRPAAAALGIQIESSLDRLERNVWCDPERIQQVVWNLLSNAIKFTSGEGKIEVRLWESENRALIQVKDSGSGIRREFLPHIFEQFRQCDDFATRSHSGLGLGLSIVRYIVAGHGGSVWAESAGEGKGATFVVELPYL